MNRFLLVLMMFGLAFSACKNEQAGTTTEGSQETTDSKAVVTTSTNPADTKYKPGDLIGSIEKLNAGFDKFLDTSSTVEVLANGFDWTEGPLWVSELDAVLFSDIPPNTIYKWEEGEGISVYLKPSGYTKTKKRSGELGSNGLILDQNRTLILCQHGDRRVARMEAPLDAPAANFRTLADNYERKKLNSPNDAVMDSRGRIYFTDPPYGLAGGIHDEDREVKFQGVYRLNLKGMDLLVNNISRPNGIGLSPDEKTIYIANSDPAHAVWYAYDFDEEDKFTNGRFFYDATEEAQDPNIVGLPDGLEVTEDGTIFATGPGGVWIFGPDATVLGKIKLENPASNLTIGGKDGKSLFITNDMYLLRVRLK